MTAGLNSLDQQRLREALVLAEGAIGLSDPNPRVGCIVGDEAGAVFGSGHTQAAGQAHAEVMALRAAAAAGADLRGATAWVTLEPCAHHGRTPPCCDALVAAGVRRVVAAVQDPFPLVAGQGLQRLRAAGIEVCVAGGVYAEASRELNIGFFSRVERSRPWVRLKMATSLDGRAALHDGSSQWITGAAARADGHAWRRRAGAVLTGAGTVLADDPRLDVREVATANQPLRVIVDTRGRLPASARIFGPPGRALVYTGEATALRPDWPPTVEIAGAPVRGGRIDLDYVLQDLATRAVNELHVEAGPTLNAALIEQGLVDELLVYLAPSLIGPGRPGAELRPLADVNDARRFRLVAAVQIDADLRLRLRSV